MIRLINITLALMALYGVFIAFREARLNERLAEQHRVLAAENRANGTSSLYWMTLL
ncbi:hypothetical protein [Stieleria bergensis]|uniref:hypothetical protein n=1 Tax=Stieleria bergensis TaxID=2528025 RepID=UPI003AF35947